MTKGQRSRIIVTPFAHIFVKSGWIYVKPDQNDQRPILHILSNTFNQQNCFVFVIFLCLSLIYLWFTKYLNMVESFIFFSAKLPRTLSNDGEILKLKGQRSRSLGWERKCKNLFVHIFVKSGSICIQTKTK